MERSEQLLRDHLVGSESLTAVYEGTLIEDASRVALTIGVTDRRVLGLSDDGEFLDVKQEYITAIRSHRQSTPAYRGLDDRLLAALGGVIAAIAFAGILLYALRVQPTGGLSTIGLSIATVVGLSVAVLARRRYEPVPGSDAGTGADATVPAETTTDAPATADATTDAPATADATTDAAVDFGTGSDSGIGFDFDLDIDPHSDHQQLVGGGIAGGLLAAVSFGWLVLFGPGVVVALLVLATIGGLALAEYGHRTDNEFDGIDVATRTEKIVEITTVDGHTVELRTDSTVDLERELGRVSTRSHQSPFESVQYDTTG